MKKLMIFVFVLLILSLSMNLMNFSNTNSLKRQIKRESIKTEFMLQKVVGGNTPFDSCYFHGDTAFFYKRGEFIGKAVSHL